MKCTFSSLLSPSLLSHYSPHTHSQEALQSLQKKVGRAEETEKENLKIHQLNLNLTRELEDYRHQTKTLMADLRAKEEEIASLRETVGTRGQLSSDVSDTYSVLGAGHVCDCVCVCVCVSVYL